MSIVENQRVGPFQIVEKLGSQKKHQVYRALQLEQQREVALKFIKVPPKVPATKALNRIQKETKILKKLRHENLVQLLGAGHEDSKYFFAYELIRGESLSQILTRRGKLAWDQVVDISLQIAQALEYMHGNEIVHLKLSPEKILLSDDGVAKVSDLRLNRSKKRRWDATDRRALEIAAYMPPEQFDGAQGTAKSDLYALGVIMFEMLTGKLPYAPDTLTEMIREKQNQPAPSVSDFTIECPYWVEKTVSKLLSINPLDRPHSARAVILALKEIKEIDSTGTSVAEKLSSSFSALNAGESRAEARQVLGLDEEVVDPQDYVDHTPFYLQTSVLVSAILILGSLMAFAMWPTSDEKLYAKAVELSQGVSVTDWQSAKIQYLQPLIERGADREYHNEASELLVRVEEKILIDRAESRKRIRRYAKTDAEERFFDAWRAESDGEQREALDLYKKLTLKLDPTGEEQHIYNIAQRKVASIQAELEKEKIDRELAQKERDARLKKREENLKKRAKREADSKKKMDANLKKLNSKTEVKEPASPDSEPAKDEDN